MMIMKDSCGTDGENMIVFDGGSCMYVIIEHILGVITVMTRRLIIRATCLYINTTEATHVCYGSLY
jgi:hypothetical protein